MRIFPVCADGGGSDPSRSRGAAIAAVILGAAVLLALSGPALSGLDPLAQNIGGANTPPSAAHWLGRDHLGRDIFTRLAVGTRLTLFVALAATLAAILLGAALGLLAVASGRVAETLVFGGYDLVRAMPSILLAMTLLVALGPGILPLTLAIGLAYAPIFAHVARAVWRRESSAGYVAAARVMAAAPLAILVRHVAPNLFGAIVTQAAIVVPRAITTDSVLSFFGFGVTPGTPTWGRMIADAVRHAETAPLALAMPVAALAAITLAFALLGDRLRLDADPLRRGMAA
jgi:ABC-type dipeptide/oligopeptide/nickel transport system permease subunit